MISYAEALRRIEQAAAPLTPVMMALGESLGHICAKTILAQEAVPAFANSSMDGFAVISSETPGILPIHGSTVAGDVTVAGKGGAWEIMTGAPIPQGYDAIVKIEDVTLLDSKQISLSAAVPKGQFVREPGTDFLPGTELIRTGEKITPAHVMALACLGIHHVPVYPKVSISLFSTGRELVDHTDPSPLTPGQIRNSNSPYLMAALSQLSAKATDNGIIADDADAFEKAVTHAAQHSKIIISTGAVSAGKHDFIPESLKRLGAEILFHKVAIRPGKPVLFARFPTGAYYFGLPGNAVSSVVGLRFFVEPLLRHLQSQPAENKMSGTLTGDIKANPELQLFLKARAFLNEQNQLCVDVLDGQESYKIHPLLAANCWMMIEEGNATVSTGSNVRIVPFSSSDWMPTCR